MDFMGFGLTVFEMWLRIFNAIASISWCHVSFVVIPNNCAALDVFIET